MRLVVVPIRQCVFSSELLSDVLHRHYVVLAYSEVALFLLVRWNEFDCVVLR